MKTQVEEKFSDFFERWVRQLDEYTQQIIRVSKERRSSNEEEGGGAEEQQLHAALISKLTTHYKEYYTVKWALAREDVLVFYCPAAWVSTFELAYTWVTGWKPSMIFRLVDSMRKSKMVVPGGGGGKGGTTGTALTELTEQQVKKIEELRVKIRLEEEKVEREMERQQVALADKRLLELARLTSRVARSSGEACSNHSQQVEGLVEVALKGMMSGLEKVMKAADCVRLKTLKGILDVLTTNQSLDFLAGTSMLLIHLRLWGTTETETPPHPTPM